jgi:O-glycosyl hydrolase
MKNFKMQNIALFILSFIFLNGSCTSEGIDDSGNGSGNADQYLEITLRPSTVYQTIKGFGASDAWSTQFVGKNWPLTKRTKIADLLFSDAFDANDNPIGIGLGQWRFNIGAGSSSQGGNSGIDDPWRRTESFMTDNGYNWTAQEGQRWFVEAAKERGVTQFTAFSNSPPITMTKNGKAHSSGGASANIEESKHSEYVDFLATVLENYKNLYGVEFNYVSPFNEPQWDWTEGQEGTPWQNTEIARITRLLDTRLKETNLNTKIEIAEAGQLNYLYETGNRPGRANQLQDFFNPSSQNYIGDLSKLAQKIAGHSYYTTFDTARLIDVRSKLNDAINDVDPSLEFWMSEYTLLENNAEMNGNGRDLGINPALYMARVIHADLTVANANSWQWWLGVSPYDYKDGLVYIDDDKNDGEVYDSKLLWTLGNYSKFIKAGDQRIGLSRSDNKAIGQSINGLLVSAYTSAVDSKYVAVIVNQRNIEIPVKLGVIGQDSFAVKAYQTSSLSADNLSYKGVTNQNDVVNIPARSIVTLVIEY